MLNRKGGTKVLIGIDVGGTFTDGVVVSKAGQVQAVAKYPTNHANLLESLTGCLDKLLCSFNPDQVERVAISTTLLTNAVLEDRLDQVGLVIEAGPGLCPSDQMFGVKPYFIAGAIDFRGREIQPLDLTEARHIAWQCREAGCDGVAVATKFAQRNNSHELALEKCLQKHFPAEAIGLSHRLYGKLNFPRRANTTYLTVASRRLFQTFLEGVEKAVRDRGITAPIVVLKADGGTTPVATAAFRPVETIYSGPAASVLGVLALNPPQATLGIIDIGGTTTDLGLILDGNPLLSAKGAEIGRFKTVERSFSVSSVAVGGDTAVGINAGQLFLSSKREGPAYCLGGPTPTPTDALRFLGLSEFGDGERAAQAMQLLAQATGSVAKAVAEKVVSLVVERICHAFAGIVKAWENEPAYRVWEVLHPHRVKRFTLTGVGGAATGLIPLVAKQLNTDWQIPEYSKVANALGAALAQPTFSATLRADTTQKQYTLAETGQQLGWPYGRGTLEQAKELAWQRFRQVAEEFGMSPECGEVTREEVFNVVNGWSTEGKIIEVAVERKAGVLNHVKEGETGE